jgi:hypothetical protein
MDFKLVYLCRQEMIGFQSYLDSPLNWVYTTHLEEAMKPDNKPYSFGAKIGGKPFKVQITPKHGTVVTGLYDDDYYYSFRRHVSVKEGDVFEAAPGKKLMLNGELVRRAIIKPKHKTPMKMGWAAEKLRIAVFWACDPQWSKKLKRFTKKMGDPYWCAMDTRSYWIGTGKTPQEAMSRLIESVKFTELMEKEDRKKGHRVIRWHVERTPGTRKELLDMEKKARKTGFILDGVEWRKAEFSKNLVQKIGR